MRYTTIIAEKPSVASEIAKIVGAKERHTQKATGWIEGNGYRVTWAFGHLVGLLRPEDIGFGGNVLPIIPETWKTGVIQSEKKDMSDTVKKQVGIIKTLFDESDRIIVATDAGREGELIFRYIYEYLGCRKPFERLWISSLTDEAIRKGLDELRPGNAMDSLSDAAHARSEADWLLGYNASRALRIASDAKRTLSLGRVQTPVLKMICERYIANKEFKPTPFWQLKATVHKDMENVDVLSVEKFSSEQNADAVLALCKQTGRMKVLSVEKKDIVSKPPCLHDLTSLQRTANSKLGLTADQTLKIAQTLYEKKFLTYPRTGSSFIPEDVFKTIPSLIGKVAGYGRFSEYAESLKGAKLCRKSVNDEKVTDHHALLPTSNIPTALTGDEKAVWELVCGRMLEAFGANSVAAQTTVLLDCAGHQFKVTGSVITTMGWKAVFGTDETKAASADDEEATCGKLPAFRQEETLNAAGFETVRKTDKPQPIYTDASLLAEMETCGKRIEDEELRETMKDIGIGTPATRAATIEILIRRTYIERQKKKLIPTELGLQVYELVKDKRIADVMTSAEWERDLTLVEKGEKSKESFDKGIRAFTLEVIDDIQKNTKKISAASVSGNCPVCGKKLSEGRYGLWCNEKEGGCGLNIPFVVLGKKLPDAALRDLIEKGVTKPMKFRSKQGKLFDASIAINKETRKAVFRFAGDDQKKLDGQICPCCGGELADDGRKLGCGCGFQLWKIQCGVALKEEQIVALLSGKKTIVKGMKSKAGKKFDASLVLNTQEKKIEFVFEGKK